MKTNAQGLKLIKEEEGTVLHAYPDPGTGGEPWTIGTGHTTLAGPPSVHKGMTITKEEADQILQRDLAKFEAIVEKYVKVPLNSNQFSALVSFVLNVGEGNFKDSSVLRFVNHKNFGGIPSRLALYNKAAGRVLPGLVRRRAREGQLFVTPVKEGTQSLPEVHPDTPIDQIKESSQVPEVSEGKPMTQSTTFWSQISIAVTSIVVPVVSVVTDWKALLVIGSIAVLGLTAYTISQRYKMSKEEGV